MLYGKINIYGSAHTIDFLLKSQAYYFAKPGIELHRAYFNPNVLRDKQVTFISNVKIQSFEVDHSRMKALAFLIEDKVLYISDTNNLFPNKFYGVDILIIDCHTWDRTVNDHLNFKDVKEYLKIMGPEKTYLTGISPYGTT